MIEILSPGLIDIRAVFENEFKAMIAENVTCEDLYSTGDRLVSLLRSELTAPEKQFIVWVKEGLPKWDLFGA